MASIHPIIAFLPCMRRPRLPFEYETMRLSYRIGPEGLLSARPDSERGGIMCISDAENEGVPKDIGVFCRQIVREYSKGEFHGIFMDFNTPRMKGSTGRILERLNDNPGIRRGDIFTPEALNQNRRGCITVIPSSVTGGSFREYIEESVKRYDKTAIDILPLCHTFTLPSKDPCGTLVDPLELSQRIRNKRLKVWRSRELCTNYIVSEDEFKNPQIILFDDEAALKAKLLIAGDAGIRYAFFLYPELSNTLPRLF